MALVPTVTQSQIQTALRGFLLAILPSGVEVVAAQQNRVPEPVSADFVLMTPISRHRLGTNEDTYADAAYTGHVAGTTLAVTAVQTGAVQIGSYLFGTDGTNSVLTGTTIVSQYSGTPNGAGVYLLSQSQQVSTCTLASGVENLLQPTMVRMQLDVHGPNSSDNAQTISTLFRDDYAYQWFLNAGWIAQGLSPLDADDPRQIPFINAEQQYETRWVIDARLQVNDIVIPPQQFATQVQATPIPADVFYKP